MTNRYIEPSELIITDRGTIYHLDLAPEHLAPTVITVGSPDRVKEVSKYFDSIEHRAQHREFITHTGYIGNKRLSVISTGIGVGNIDIVFNEIDALVNIDLATRTIKEQHTSLSVVRLGTCGTLQADIPVDSMIVSSYAIGFDNLMLFYDMENSAEEQDMLAAFKEHTATAGKNVYPYISEGSGELRSLFNMGYVHGITVTCPGFYGAQGRMLRLQPAFPNILDSLASFTHAGHRVTNFEMETSAIYGLGELLRHKCASISVAVANRANKTFSANTDRAVDVMIHRSLEIIVGA